MNQPHRIRLRGPWQRCVIEGKTCEEQRVNMPSSWNEDLGDEFVGVVEYTRHFNRPTGLGARSSLHIRFENVQGQAVLHLNGKEVGEFASGGQVFEITSLLESRNELRLRVSNRQISEPVSSQAEQIQWGIVGDVYLEIVETNEADVAT